MGDVIPIEPSKKKTEKISQTNRRNSGWRYQGYLSAPADAEKGQVIPVSFDNSDKQLQLLRYKTRELDKRRLTVYSGSTELKLPGDAEDPEIIVRIMVKNSKIDYYFFCPNCGKKIFGSVDSRAYRDKPNCLSIPWTEIQQMVRTQIIERVREGKYANCRQTTMRE